MTKSAIRFAVLVTIGLAGPGPAIAQSGMPPAIRQVVEQSYGADPAVLAFYQARDFAPAWSDADAASLQAALMGAESEGLDPKDYYLPSGRNAMARDVGLTAAALTYIAEAGSGRPKLRTIDSDIDLPPAALDIAADLAAAIRDHRVAALLAEAPPRAPEYAHLKSALARYRSIRDGGGWLRLPPGASGDFSSNDAIGALLRERLRFEDPILAADPSADLTTALQRFQARHGLEPDGRLGVRSLAELNISAEDRVHQIIANMERWRWLPRAFEPDFIVVNVPDASLSLILNGQAVMTSRVVVGKPSTPTPIFRAEGAGITVNPVWNVPDSIARKEILPKLKRNPAYLQSQDMILVNGPADDPSGLHVRWRNIPAGTFPFRIQQRSGQKNSLGTLKFELPNRFDVYLHDTPAKQAFALSTRDISHGCVRVQQILPLTSYALNKNLDGITAIQDAVSNGETRYLPLQRKLPVYFLYWTAFAGSDGTFQFRPDIYGRDRRLVAALYGEALARVSANFPNCSRG
ncbi:MAG: L,D-transpeptidase family protein [Pseudomonadota bacterium]